MASEETMDSYEVLKTDVLVVGGGGAGVRAAIEADDQNVNVCLVSKGPVSRSGLTPMAYPSYQAAFGFSDPRDNADVHFNDIIEVGRHLCDQDLARALAEESVERALDAERYGVKFKKEGGRFFQVHHPGQSYPRNLYLSAGGYGLIAGLKKELDRRSRVQVLEDFTVSRLLKHQGEVVGAFGLNMRDGRFYAVEAKSTVLACGGYEELWGNTDTAPDSTGDGVFLGFQAGADVIDLEMALYYPAAFAYPESVKGVLIQYETFLAKDKLDFRLVNNRDEEFLPEGPLPVRDVLMRLMFTEIEEGRGTENNAVWIDPLRSSKTKKEIEECINKLIRGPDRNLKSLGIDIRKDRLETVPAVHYTLGGVHISANTQTSVPGLFAAGENASSIHGANRISGNALAETQVFGRRAGMSASAHAQRKEFGTLPAAEVNEEMERWNGFVGKKNGGTRAHVLRNEMKQIMDRYMGPNRREEGMKKALQQVVDLRENALSKVAVEGGGIFNVDWRTAIEVSMTLRLAELTIRSALFRKETRGHHFRPDYPETSETAQHTLVQEKGQGIEVTYKAVRTLNG
jgi:succinate dehydrogenase/fumarate reductase flavoprotein subunit